MQMDIPDSGILGVAMCEIGLFEDGLEQLHEAVSENKRNAQSQCHLGSCLMACGRENEAIKAFQLAKALDSLMMVAYNNLGICYFILGMFDEAAANFADLLEVIRSSQGSSSLTQSERSNRRNSQLPSHSRQQDDDSASISNTGDKVHEWEVLNNLGLVRWKAGRLTEFDRLLYECTDG